MTENEKLYELYLKANEIDKEKYMNEILMTDETKDIIKKQLRKYWTFQDIYDDLRQTADYAVFIAIKSFDSSENTPLEAYIAQSVKFSLLNAINDDKVYKMGQGTYLRIKLLKSLVEKYPNDNKKVVEEFKKETNIKNDSTINNYFEYLNRGDKVFHFDKKIDNEFDVTRLDNYSSNELDPEEYLTREALSNTIKEYFDRLLSNVEKKYVMLYLGFSGKNMSVIEIANKYGVSRQYVSNVIKKALDKLKKNNELLSELTELANSRNA